MSTTAPAASRALFVGLIGDAAVFPPGSFSLEAAIARRERRRVEPCADLVGPLLLPPQLVAEAVAGSSPLTAAVIGRPGADQASVLTAAGLLANAEGHALAGIEIGYASRWRDALELGVPVAVEVVADETMAPALADLDEVAGDQQVLAKLRIGALPDRPAPTAAQISAFLAGVVNAGLACKMTGGMHSAVSHTAVMADGPQQRIGILNVLLATDGALQGAAAEELNDLLAEHDADRISQLVRALDDVRVASVRNTFHSYGCCDVLDPIHDLSVLSLIEESA